MLMFFKSELKRAILSKNMAFAIFICIVSFFLNFDFIYSLFTYSVRGVTYFYNLSVYWGIISFLFLIIATIPFATSYLEDYSSGYYSSVKDKIGGFKYVITKFVVNFIAGGLVIFIPFVLFFLFLLVLKGVSLRDLDYATEVNISLRHIFEHSQVQYMLLNIILSSIAGATFSTVALAVSIYTKNKHLVMVFPFLCYIASAIILSDYNLNLQMIFNLDTDINLSMTYRLIYALFVVLVSISVFIIKYILDEKNNKEIAFKLK